MTLKSDKWIKRKCFTGNIFKVSYTDVNTNLYKEQVMTEDQFDKFLEDSGVKTNVGYIHSDVKEAVMHSTVHIFPSEKHDNVRVNLYRNDNQPMIEPFYPNSIKVNEQGERIASYGLSSFGYDIRLGRHIKLFKKAPSDWCDDSTVIVNQNNSCITTYQKESDLIIDPMNFDPEVYQEYTDVDSITIPPYGFILGHSVEYFRMPKDTMGICMGKSTIARTGTDILVTPLEPGWEGYLTLEIINVTGLPVKITTGTGICQINFIQSDEDCEVSYADRGGKYQHQEMIPVDPKV